MSDYNLDEKFDEQKIRIEEIKSMGKVINYKLENDMTGEIYEFTAQGAHIKALYTCKARLTVEHYYNIIEGEHFLRFGAPLQ